MTLAPDRLDDFALGYTEAWYSQDPARVAEHYAPEGSLTINGGTQPFVWTKASPWQRARAAASLSGLRAFGPSGKC